MHNSASPLAADLLHSSDNPHIQVPDLPARRLEVQLRQRSHWHDIDRQLTLFNGHYLSVCDRQRPEQEELVINLAYLAPVPRYESGTLRQRFSMGAMALVLTLSLGAWVSSSLIPALTLAMLSVIALMLMSARPGRWVFYTALGDTPVCSVLHGFTGRKDAVRLVALLAERIEGASVVLPVGSRRLAAELAEHRRILLSGGLSRRQYQCARQRLLAQLGKRRPASEVKLA
ncbi:MAG: hypothetical protein CVV10_01340 [Gammaproteobacteria bacterium HGW-Gammaproteobacteria-14]|nr:MAG: hypothetical protein CVV10_01340 [Gammaproteobacteria bacterium HGW-Gammaproteobacteria-14]